MLEKFNERILHELRNAVREEVCNFIIVECDGGRTLYLNKFIHIGITMGHFKCYVIEIRQPFEVCKKYNCNGRSEKDIRGTISDLDKHAPPAKTVLLDPTSLLVKTASSTSEEVVPSNFQENPSSFKDLAVNIASLLQNKSVMNLIQSTLSTSQQQQPKPLMFETFSPSAPQQQYQQQSQFVRNMMQVDNESFDHLAPIGANNSPTVNTSRNTSGKENFNNNYNQQQQQQQIEEFPTFSPNRIVDYKHAHLQTFEEQLLEFKVFRVVEYKHYANPKLRDFVKDIDTDKIIEKRKSVALRKKILEYLKNAERPEDTVSNPKYPRNWEVIKLDRPPLRNKRKKKLTPKIQQVIRRLEETGTSRNVNWMKAGYTEGIESSLMDYEDISSDEEGSEPVEIVLEDSDSSLEEVEIIDKFKDLPKTIPDFNHSKHLKTIKIEDLLCNPNRLARPSKILIILRGPPGSGKSHLTQLIRRKELEMGNSEVRILSIDDYFDHDEDEKDSEEYESQMIDNYLHQMVKFLKKTIKENLFRFIIIDAENVDSMFYNQFYLEGASSGFATFTIELYQTLEICLSQNIHNRSTSDIAKAIEKFNTNRVPNNHTLVIATALYAEYNCLINRDLKTNVKEEKSDAMDTDQQPSTSKQYQEPAKMIDYPPIEITDPDVPKFNWHQRSIVDIRNILEEPGRSSRKKSIIFLRGPSCSGKTCLAELISRKESEQGNIEGNIILANENFEAMLKTLRDTLRKQIHNFIIVDSENGAINDYMELHKVGTSFGFQCYAIELYHDSAFCLKNASRSLSEIENVLEDMQLNPIPDDHILLNPSYLYLNRVLVSKPLKSALKAGPSSENIMASSSVQIEGDVKKENSGIINEEFFTRWKQPIMIQDKFIEKNIEPPAKLPEFNWYNRDIIDIRELLEVPGRLSRPDKIMIVLRGAPGSGKTFLAGLIERKEVEKGNRDQFKLLTIDDYFATTEDRDYIDHSGIACKEQYRKYNFEPLMLETYMEKVVKELDKITLTSEFKFIIVDADCCDLLYYNRLFNSAQSHGYTGYAIELMQDDDICLQYNDHKRDAQEILEKNKILRTKPTPDEHILLDPEYLYKEYQYKIDNEEYFDEVMDVSDVSESDEENDESTFGPLKKSTTTSKWDDDGDAPESVIERLDGTRNKTFEHLTMADYIQSEWTMRPSMSGKKRVRWADIEEKKIQEKMRAVGFIVGQTDWSRMTDTSDGKNALEKTKFIEGRKK